MKKLRVLIVEDSQNDTDLMLRALRLSDYNIEHQRIETASELRHALEADWDVIVSDYHLPTLNALEALSILRDSHKDIPFIVVSGAIGEETAVETMKAGAHDYVMKDRLQRLAPAIERELREAKSRAKRAEAELALYQSEEKFRFLFEHNPVPMWVVEGGTLTFLDVNQAAVERYGYSRKEFLQLTLADIQIAYTDAFVVPPSHHRHRGEAIHQLKDGRRIEVELHSDTVKLSGREWLFYIAHDISERKQTVRELVRAREAALEMSRLKSEFLANVSHEIRTPLNGIIGVTDLLTASVKSPKEKEWIDLIRISGNSLLSVLNQVLDFSKVESGEMTREHVPFELDALLRETVDIFSYAASKKQLTLKLLSDAKAPINVIGDPCRLRQVLINLLDNAVKFTKTGGVTVQVSTITSDTNNMTLRFSVSDTGIGISDTGKSRLFRPFSQADSSLTREFGGTGLGLVICQKLVTLLGGQMGYDSQYHQGSTFWFSLPLAKTDRLESGNSHPPSAPVSPLQNQKILVVEDNPVNKKVLLEMINRMGHAAQGVSSSEEALNAVTAQQFDAILMDCQMPTTDGYATTAIIRAREKATGHHIPIIAVTAHALADDRDKCLRAGMDDYLAKPITTNALTNVLNKWLTSRK